MKNFTRLLLLGAFLCLSVSPSFSQNYTLHWGSTSWAGGTFLKTVTNIGGSGVDATITITNSSPAGNVTTATTAVNNAFQYNSPAVGAVAGANWYMPGSTTTNPLVYVIDWTALTYNVTTKITFSRAVNGVSLYIGDMDRTNPLSYVDRITITGKKGTATVPNPMIVKFQPTETQPDTVLIQGNTAYGNATLSNGNVATTSMASQGSTIFVQFDNPITELDLVWDEGPGAVGPDPAAQAIVFGDVSFNKVIPEYVPIADNFTNTPMPQGNAATVIPRLTASDVDGTIASYKILTLPTAAQGVISIPCPATPSGSTCIGGFADLTAATLTANPTGITLTPTQATGMRFDPASNFIGSATFTFNATDNTGNVSNTANYILPVTGTPPIVNNIMENSIINTAGATVIQPLSGSDQDDSISVYRITTLPTTGQGVLSVPCPPNLTGATCTGGFQNLNATVLAAYPTGIPLTAAQASGMRFAPTAAYVGNATFNYTAVDFNSNTSNTANYTIPVSATATFSRPPLAQNVMSGNINNSLSNTLIPALSGTDLDGSVVSYRIVTIPTVASGVLRVACPPTPSGLTCVSGYADVLANTVLTPAQAATLYFDPAATFTGNATFTYNATDNASLVGNTATYTMPVINSIPIAGNVNAIVAFGASNTMIPALAGSDDDAAITGYTLTSVPTAAQGTISIPCPATPTGATCTSGYADITPAIFAANSNAIALTPTQAAGLRFRPGSGYSGTATFTYTATNGSGITTTAANYSITVPAQPPVVADVSVTTMSSILPNTALSTGLAGTDADGTIASYTILSLPDPTQGIVSVVCGTSGNPTPTGATCTGGFAQLTASVLAANPTGINISTSQAGIGGLYFFPTTGYKGLASFTYIATDNSGLLSVLPATYTIPITTVGNPANIPPITKNVTATSMPSSNAATTITGLNGTDPDGSIASYRIMSVPDATNVGVLSIPCPATPTGATCSGGFANLDATVLAANPTGISLTTTQASNMRFDPAANFTGLATFTYVAVDNGGSVSSGAVYTIPVTNTPPIASPISNSDISQTAGATTIQGLSAIDPDGTIASYAIESLPPTTQGVISVPCPPNLTGATCTGGYQNLTAAILSNYTDNNIPLTTTQAAGMRFTPATSFTGSVVFNYHAIDNAGLVSNATTYLIPVTGANPVSNSVVAAKMYRGLGPTAIAGLNSTDADGTISSYILTSLPPTSQGVLSITCPPTPTAATCTGGFANLTPAVLSANPTGIYLSISQAANMRFAPSSTFNGNAMFNYMAVDNNNNFSNVATYTIPTGSYAALPLSLLNFTGERAGDNIAVKWKTTNEENVDHYEVEYSEDGTNYSTGGSVRAYNTTSNNYQHTLVNYTRPLYYIRLKSVDANGDVKYSAIIVVKLSSDGIKSLLVTPNPIVDKIQLKISSDEKATAMIKIMTVFGQTLIQSKQQLVKGDNLIVVKDGTNNLSKGTYIATAVINGKVLTSKFVIQ